MIAATTTTLGNGDLSWSNEGYYVIGNSNWKDISMTAVFKYDSGGIGIFPRFYSTDTYVMFIVHNDTVSGTGGPTTTTGVAYLSAQILGQVISLAKVENLAALVATTDYTLRVDIKGTNFKAYINGVLTINVEYGAISSGSAALYATANNACHITEASSFVPDAWQTNELLVNGGIIQIQKLSNDDSYIHMENPNGITELYIRQQVTVGTPHTYTLSCSYKGAITGKIIEINGASPSTYTNAFAIAADWTTASYTVTLASDCTSVYVQFSPTTTTPVDVNNTQFENKTYGTDYIPNNSLIATASRTMSSIAYPSAKHISADFGGISLWFNPSIPYTAASGLSCVLFEYGSNTANCIRVGYGSGILYLTYGATTISRTIDLPISTWVHVVANWSGSNLDLYVNNVGQSVAGIYPLTSTSGEIILGLSSDTSLAIFNGIFDEFVIFSKPIDSVRIHDLYTATNPVGKSDDILLHSTFDYEVSDFATSLMEITPAPLYGSPVIAVKQDGTVMRKVSFYDPYSGEFCPYNTEQIIYDGKSNFVQVGSTNIDPVSFKIQIHDNAGNLIGDPYTVKDRRIYMTLTDSQKKALRGTRIAVTYQPKDAYTVDFNIGVPDSFRVNIGKHDGQNVSVTYEGNKVSIDKLASMVELNPLLNPQHEGFLYIAKTGQDVSNFRVKASPDDLQADGVSECSVIIEPIDSSGNFVSNAILNVSAQRGSIIPNYDTGSINLRKTSGRYIYRYRSPLIHFADFSLPELTESINVIDSKTGLGVQIPITLTLSSSYPNEGTITLEQQNWEKVAAYILDKVMDNFGKKAADLPAGLGNILDLNADGIIDLGEIIWLNQYKLTQTLYASYTNLVLWYQTNT